MSAGMSVHSDGSFFEDLEPRKPPPIPNYPLPFGFIDKPRPLVPDVSLIFENSGEVGASASTLSANPVPQTRSSPPLAEPPPVPAAVDKQSGQHRGIDSLANEVGHISKKLEGQESLISRIELKLDKILEFQEKLAAHLFQRGEASPVTTVTPKSVRNPSPRNKQTCFPNGVARQNGQKQQQCQSDSGSSVNSSTPVNRRGHEESPNHMLQRIQRSNSNARSGPMERKFANNRGPSKADEDLSAILKDIQLPNMNEPSVFSDVSGIKSLELVEYNDESFRSESGVESPVLGASASAFGSSSLSSEDETGGVALRPSATFYNNVLGNVNRLLKSKPEHDEKRANSNDASDVSRKLGVGREQERRVDNHNNQHIAQFNGSRSSSSSGESNLSAAGGDKKNDGETVVEATKRYLEKIGVQFASPSPAERQLNLAANSNNYMIQQNVYNSIYIPTVNCVPPVSETMDSNSTSGNFKSLARKYAPHEELQQYETAVAGSKGNGPSGLTDTTVYGMSSNNLSFATKQYLQRYGLVNQESDNPKPDPSLAVNKTNRMNDRILDITAIQQQPKLL